MPKPPLALKLICIINVLALGCLLLALVHPSFHRVDVDYRSFLFVFTFLAGAIALGAATYAYWTMRRWGIYLYAALFISSAVLLALNNQAAGYLQIFYYGAALAIGIKYVRNMT